MKYWRVWLFGSVGIVVIAVCAILVALWRNVDTEWATEATAAQFALDHSPLNHIDAHTQFDLAEAQQVFQGTDIFNRKMYAFVFGAPLQVTTISASAVVPLPKIQQLATQSLHLTDLYIRIGYLNPGLSAMFPTKHTSVVYEVYGLGANGRHCYFYYDGQTAQLLWKYMLST